MPRDRRSRHRSRVALGPGKRVKYRGRTGIVANHEAVTDVVAKTITIRFSGCDESVVQSFFWPWVKVLDDEGEA